MQALTALAEVHVHAAPLAIGGLSVEGVWRGAPISDVPLGRTRRTDCEVVHLRANTRAQSASELSIVALLAHWSEPLP